MFDRPLRARHRLAQPLEWHRHRRERQQKRRGPTLARRL
jgi:hypothetical protein